jgi:hypothetical protein
MMLSNIKVSGKGKAKRLGLKHNLDHVKISVKEIAEELKKLDKLVCGFCDTPIKIWEIGSYSCISCDRHKDPLAPYRVGNIQFTHNRCNSQDGAWRHSDKKTIDDFRGSLTKVGVNWVSSDSVEAEEIFNKNKEYFRSNKKQQIQLDINMNKPLLNNSPIILEIEGVGRMILNEVSAAKLLVEMRKLAPISVASGKRNTASLFVKQPNSVTGRVRSYTGGLPGGTKLSARTIQEQFPGEIIHTGLLSQLKAEGVVLPTKERGVYLSVPSGVASESLTV